MRDELTVEIAPTNLCSYNYSRWGKDVAEPLKSALLTLHEATPHPDPPTFYLVGSHVKYIIVLGERGGAAEIAEVVCIVTRCPDNNTRLPGA